MMDHEFDFQKGKEEKEKHKHSRGKPKLKAARPRKLRVQEGEGVSAWQTPDNRTKQNTGVPREAPPPTSPPPPYSCFMQEPFMVTFLRGDSFPRAEYTPF